VLTSKRVCSSEENSELVRSKRRRFAVLQEPEGGAKMNANVVKESSTGERR
jgi:hypothetical protein